MHWVEESSHWAAVKDIVTASGSKVVLPNSLTFSSTPKSIGAANWNELCCSVFPSPFSISITVSFVVRSFFKRTLNSFSDHNDGTYKEKKKIEWHLILGWGVSKLMIQIINVSRESPNIQYQQWVKMEKYNMHKSGFLPWKCLAKVVSHAGPGLWPTILVCDRFSYRLQLKQ